MIHRDALYIAKKLHTNSSYVSHTFDLYWMVEYNDGSIAFPLFCRYINFTSSKTFFHELRSNVKKLHEKWEKVRKISASVCLPFTFYITRFSLTIFMINLQNARNKRNSQWQTYYVINSSNSRIVKLEASSTVQRCTIANSFSKVSGNEILDIMYYILTLVCN